MKNILKFIVVLLIVNLVAAFILASVYNATKPKIEEQERLLKKASLRQVMPGEIGDRIEPVYDDRKNIKYWRVFKGDSDRVRGYIFIAKRYGYSSVIETMVGMKPDATITGVRILSQNETPGLGAKIVEIATGKTVFGTLRDFLSQKKQPKKEIAPYFTEQFKGHNIRRIDISKTGIQAITGATISSEACIESIKEKASEILNGER